PLSRNAGEGAERSEAGEGLTPKPSPSHACGAGPSLSRGAGEGFSRAIERAVALHRHPIAVAALREIIPHRVVLDRAVVPERHRVRLPAEAAVELRRLAMP